MTFQPDIKQFRLTACRSRARRAYRIAKVLTLCGALAVYASIQADPDTSDTGLAANVAGLFSTVTPRVREALDQSVVIALLSSPRAAQEALLTRDTPRAAQDYRALPAPAPIN